MKFELFERYKETDMSLRPPPLNSLSPTRPQRRTVLATLAAGLASGTDVLAHAQADWPTRPVKLISPYAAGGASDLSARALGEYLAKALGQQFVVENKPGAGTRLGTEFVARAP